MTTLEAAREAIPTVADLLERLGGVSPDRILMKPPPGTATEADLIRAVDHDDRPCELVDGVLVEKAMSFRESLLMTLLASLIRAFVDPRNLGLVTGSDAMIRLFPGLVRLPDVAFVSWDRVPGRCVPSEPVVGLAPDLAVEILSPSNTPAEMARKLREYFAAGVRLVWVIDPEARTAAVFTDLDRSTVLTEAETLEGGEVLPGFVLPLRDFFGELDRKG
jgi:Uma2 family endonuclease